MPAQHTPNRSCETCGASFYVKPSDIAHGRGRFCSVSCRWANPHASRRTPMTDRLWARINKNGPVPDSRPDLGPCWIWTGQTGYGYGRISPGGAAKNGRAALMVHRVVYELIRGPIPDGLVLDHLCRVPICCNPRHLEPVTQRINNLRGTGYTARSAAKTHCPSGHPYDDANTYITPSGDRKCRECSRRRQSGIEQRHHSLIRRVKGSNGSWIEGCDRPIPRKTHCKQGHPFDVVNKNGHQRCSICVQRWASLKK